MAFFEYASLNGAGVTTNANVNGLAVAATTILTMTSQPDNLDTYTVGTQTYTIETSLTDSPNFVLRGADAAATVTNLVAAVMNTAGEGTLYGTGTVENVDATAADGTGDTVDFTSKVAGTGGNSIVSTDTGSGNGTFTAGVFAGGVDTDKFQVLNGGAQMNITDLIVFLMDATVLDTDYGAVSTLSNGVSIKVMTGASTVVKDLLGGTPLTIIRDFYRVFQKVEKGTGWVQAHLHFDVPVQINAGDRLEVEIADDLTGLDEHFFYAIGA